MRPRHNIVLVEYARLIWLVLTLDEPPVVTKPLQSVVFLLQAWAISVYIKPLLGVKSWQTLWGFEEIHWQVITECAFIWTSPVLFNGVAGWSLSNKATPFNSLREKMSELASSVYVPYRPGQLVGLDSLSFCNISINIVEELFSSRRLNMGALFK